MTKRPILPWVLLSCLPLLGWWTYGLFDLDEGYYAAIVAEMNRRGEWVTPYFNGHPWFEKPILLYWLAKPCIALFGVWVGPRVPSILATAGLYALVAWFARRRLSVRSEVLAPLILGSSLLVVAAGRMMLTDPLLVLCLSAAFITFWESLVDRPQWRILTAFCLGLGVLAKGPVALILFVPIAGWTFYREKDLRSTFRGSWLPGVLVLVATICIWYVPAYLANGKFFVDEFLIKQNIGRFTGGDQAHTLHGPAGWVFYIPILLLGMAPWSFLLFRAWPKRDRSVGVPADVRIVGEDANATSLRRYFATWGLTIFLFFSISGAKLPHYVLPVTVPFALLVADDLARRWPELTPKRLALPVAWLLAIWAIAQSGFQIYHDGNALLPGFHREVQDLAQYVAASAKPTDTVAEYQMSRREHDLGTGKPKIQETSHPSLLLYLNRTVVDTDDFQDLLKQPSPVWIITRWNRIGDFQRAVTDKAGWSMEDVNTPVKQDLYRLYKLERR